MAHRRQTSVLLTRLGVIALAGMLVLAACQPETVIVDREIPVTVEKQVKEVVKETVIVEKVVEKVVTATAVVEQAVETVAEEAVSENPEPEEGRVELVQGELDAAIRAVIRASNQAHIDALSAASIDPLLHTVSSGPWLEFCERWVTNLRESGLYAITRLEDLQILSVGVLRPGESVVVATTIERWSEIEYRRRADDRVVRIQPPALYYETYFMFMENGQWKVWDIELDQRPFLTLVNIVGQVFVNEQLAREGQVICCPGVTIRTGHDGFASLIYSNGGVTHLGSDTSLQLVEIEPAVAGRPRGLARPLAQGWFARCRQWAGSTWNNVRRTVFTSVAAWARPIETHFAVHVAQDQSTNVEVFEGVVDVYSSDITGQPIPEGSVSVKAGMQTLVRPETPPQEPFPIGEQPKPRPADLVIPVFETTGPAVVEESGRIAVPVRMVIRNQGDTAASMFKVSIGYFGPMGGSFYATVAPGPGEPWHVWTSEPLGAGSEVELTGTVTLRSDLWGEKISLIALADSCAGDEDVPAFCRVEESNEENNESRLLQVSVPPLRSADLVIPVFETTGPAVLEESGRIAVPVRMVLRNQGGAAADVFKISVDYIGPSGRFPAPFGVPGQEESWYAWTSGPLGAGSQVELNGMVTLGSDLQGETVSLTALADSCAGEEFRPEFCRIEESDEENNESSLLQVSLIPPATPEGCYPNLPSPRIFYSRKDSIEGSAKDRHWIGISNSADYPDELFVPAPELPPCGLNDNASRTWVHVYDSADDSRIYGYCAWPRMGTELWFAAAEGEYKSVYISVEDRKCDIKYTSNSIAVP